MEEKDGSGDSNDGAAGWRAGPGGEEMRVLGGSQGNEGRWDEDAIKFGEGGSWMAIPFCYRC